MIDDRWGSLQALVIIVDIVSKKKYITRSELCSSKTISYDAIVLCMIFAFQ